MHDDPQDSTTDSRLLERDRVIQDLTVLLEHERTCTGGQVLHTVRQVRAHLCPPGTLRAASYRAAMRVVRGLTSEAALDVARLPVTQWLKLSKALRPYTHLRRAARARRELARLRYRPLISVITPVYNVEKRWLTKAVASVMRQRYPHWELCLVDDASPAPHIAPLLDRYASHPRIRVRQLHKNVGIAAASNEALALANGDFVALLDNDDELHPDALLEVAKKLNADPNLDLIYTDEDKLLPTGLRTDPFRKPGWNPDLLMSCNYITHLSVFRRRLVQSIGGFRPGFDGSQDYDLLLRTAEASQRIAHIPKVLYHWRVIPGSTAHSSAAKPKAYSAARRALAESSSRRGEPADVSMVRPGVYRLRYAYEKPSVAVLLPHAIPAPADLRHALGLQAFPQCELVMPRSEDDEPLLSPGITEVPTSPDLSTFETLNHLAAHTDADFLLIATDVLQQASPGWLNTLLEHGQRPGIGIVGSRVLGSDGRSVHTGHVLDENARPVTHFGGLYAEGIHTLVYEKVVRNCSAVSGNGLLVRRSLFDQLGGFCTDDPGRAVIDFCLKATAQGLRIVYTPFAELTLASGVSPREEVAPSPGRMPSDPYFSPRLLREARRAA